MKRRHLEIEALRALVAIDEASSFSAAAQRLGRTQSAVSLQIRRLEETLGQTLLKRVQGRVDGPTAEGVLLIAYAREILRLNDEAYASVAESAATGSLRFGVPEELMEHVFPPVMRRFQALFPRMRVTLRTGPSPDLRQALAAGELDLILFKHCDAATPKGCVPVWSEALAWMAGKGFATGLPTPLPLALFGENCVFRIAVTAALAKVGVAWQLAYTGSSVTGLRQAVMCGLGVGVLPRSLLLPGMVEIAAGLPHLPDAHLAAAFASGQPHPAAERFVALMGEELRTQRGMRAAA